MIKLRFTQKCFHWSTMEWTYIPCWKARWILCGNMKHGKCWWQLIFVFKSSGTWLLLDMLPTLGAPRFLSQDWKNIILFTARQHLYIGTARTGQLWSRTVALICRNAVISTHNMAPQFMKTNVPNCLILMLAKCRHIRLCFYNIVLFEGLLDSSANASWRNVKTWCER